MAGVAVKEPICTAARPETVQKFLAVQFSVTVGVVGDVRHAQGGSNTTYKKRRNYFASKWLTHEIYFAYTSL